ncbi:hypothetical protein PBY51_013724 [Eleginops maclovinus]|uniref:Uncharacterized protein n=1 Tax=Eleginops maclovinus TaxID=56733 RepID=A0AAN7Y2U5_ELEMC|nr:hypothetical protein PBY51_013724 [Eleginops maclovinus]
MEEERLSDSPGWRLSAAVLRRTHPSSSLYLPGETPQPWCLDVCTESREADTACGEQRQAWNQISDNRQRASD